MTVEFPRALLREKSHAWNLAGVAVSGGQLGSGFSTLVRSDGGGFWTCDMADISLSGRSGSNDSNRQRQKISTLLWRAVRQACDGGVNRIIVPRNDALFVPWPDGVARNNWNVIHDDETELSDGSEYYQPVIDVTCDEADMRDTSLRITINVGSSLVGGESFSIEHPTVGWRMYEISTVVEDDDDVEVTTITFNPPLREGVTADTQLEFDRPRCLMRLVQPSSMNLTVQPWSFNTSSVSFVEAPTDGL